MYHVYNYDESDNQTQTGFKKTGSGPGTSTSNAAKPSIPDSTVSGKVDSGPDLSFSGNAIEVWRYMVCISGYAVAPYHLKKNQISKYLRKVNNFK